MQTLRDARGKPPRVTGQIRPALAGVLRALDALSMAVREALTEGADRAENAPPGVFITQDTASIGRRTFMRACRAGLIKGTFFAHRKWHATPDAYAAYLREHGRPADAPEAPPAPANDTAHEGETPTAAEVEEELRRVGHTLAPRRRGAR